MTSYRPTWRPTEEQKERHRRMRQRRAYLRRQIRAAQLRAITKAAANPKTEN
jgi:hypothetical protein